MKTVSSKRALCTLALFAACAAMPLSANAQDTMSNNGAMSGAMSSDGSMMNSDGTMMNADPMMMQSMQISGSVVRRYIDRDGNITAIDVRTANGVQQMRFSPAMPASEMMNYRMGAMVNPTGMTTMGVLRYDPDGSMTANSGAMMMKGNTTGAKSVVEEDGMMSGGAMMNGGMNGQSLNGQPMSGKMMKGMFKGARLMMVAPDGQMMAVTMQGNSTMVATSSGQLELMKDANGAYVIPDTMTGARMMLVLKDGQQLPVDTVDGKLMVTLSDGTMRPLNAKGKVMMK